MRIFKAEMFMKIIKRLILLLLFIWLIGFFSRFFNQPVLAANEFVTNYQTTYTVNQDASVVVEQEISLVNQLANVYADQYKVTLGTTRVEDVWASDGQGSIEPKISKTENATVIELVFNQQFVGKGKELVFKLGYKSLDYAQLKGKVLEISIPKLAKGEQNIDAYQAVLKVPVSFGSPIYILPEYENQTSQDNYQVYRYNKAQAYQKSITASFGASQIFSFKLIYHLQNPKTRPALIEYALPPDTPFQQVFYQRISPPPENIVVDQDGNWLAKELVDANSTLKVEASGSAEVRFKPISSFGKQPLTDQSAYLTATKFWPVDQPEIQALAEKYNQPEEIYDYLVNHLTYNYQRLSEGLERRGAGYVLDHPNDALCPEFTDLFITIARAAGIPAREVNGYAYTTNPDLRPLSLKQDILHAWPQYYDQKQQLWRSVDPTWGQTTGGVDYFHRLDLDHFSFVFHGRDDQYPYPPGSYKDQFESKDVLVEFGEKPQPREKLTLTADFPKRVLAGRPVTGQLKIANLGNFGRHHLVFSHAAVGLLSQKQSQKVEVLPPYGHYEKKLSLGRTNLWQSGKIELTISLDNQKEQQTISVVSPLNPYFFPYGLYLVLGLTIFFLIVKIILIAKRK